MRWPNPTTARRRVFDSFSPSSPTRPWPTARISRSSAPNAVRLASSCHAVARQKCGSMRLMTFQAVSGSELVIDTDNLLIRPSSEADAAEAFGLLTHPELQFVDPARAPRDVDD